MLLQDVIDEVVRTLPSVFDGESDGEFGWVSRCAWFGSALDVLRSLEAKGYCKETETPEGVTLIVKPWQ